MFFTVTDNFNLPVEDQKTLITQLALNKVINHAFWPCDMILDTYLQNNYKMGLKPACEYLITKHLRIYPDTVSHRYIIRFDTSENDKLAQLITYGNLELLGSNILKEAFKQ